MVMAEGPFACQARVSLRTMLKKDANDQDEFTKAVRVAARAGDLDGLAKAVNAAGFRSRICFFQARAGYLRSTLPLASVPSGQIGDVDVLSLARCRHPCRK